MRNARLLGPPFLGTLFSVPLTLSNLRDEVFGSLPTKPQIPANYYSIVSARILLSLSSPRFCVILRCRVWVCLPSP